MRKIERVEPSEFGLKVLKKGRVSPFCHYQYPGKGEWTETRSLGICRSGWHYYRTWEQLARGTYVGDVWLVEIAGKRVHSYSKSVGAEIRLVKKLGTLGRKAKEEMVAAGGSAGSSGEIYARRVKWLKERLQGLMPLGTGLDQSPGGGA